MRSVVSSNTGSSKIVSDESSSSENEDYDDNPLNSSFSNSKPIRCRTRSNKHKSLSVSPSPKTSISTSRSTTKLHKKSNDDDSESDGEPRTNTRKSKTKKSKNKDSIARGGVACPFPWKLHDMLDYCMSSSSELGDDIPQHIVSWNSTGTAFAVMNSKVFVQQILPRFFSQTKYASFQRQLNLYGFIRSSSSVSDTSATRHYSFYSHPHFIRGQRDRVRYMTRCKIKGTGKKRFMDDDDGTCTLKNGHIGTDNTDSQETNFGGKNKKRRASKNKVAKFTVDCSNDTVHDDDMSMNRYTNSEPVVEDGDLLFFEGSPFHFLDPEPNSVPLLLLPPPVQQQHSPNGTFEDENFDTRGCQLDHRTQFHDSIMVDHCNNFYQPSAITTDEVSPLPCNIPNSIQNTSIFLSNFYDPCSSERISDDEKHQYNSLQVYPLLPNPGFNASSSLWKETNCSTRTAIV